MDALAATICWLAMIEAVPQPLPPLSTLDRFPSRSVAQDAVKFATQHVRWVELQISLCGPQREAERLGWYDWLGEANACRECWSLLDDAWRYRCQHERGESFSAYFLERNWHGEDVCGAYLTELRRRIGTAAYWSGTMPPVAPVWRFSRD